MLDMIQAPQQTGRGMLGLDTAARGVARMALERVKGIEPSS